MLGIHGYEEPADMDQTADHIAMENHSEETLNGTIHLANKNIESEREKPVEHAQVDWNKFKEEFSAMLQTSQEKIAMDSNEMTDDLSKEAIHEQLLINAISMLHSSEQEGTPVSQPSFNSFNSAMLRVGELSPLRQRKRLLSQGTLETIHESEIDKVLEMADVPNQQGDENQNPPTEAPPLPKFVWDSEDNGDASLMKELEQLSLSQSAESSTVDLTATHVQGNRDKCIPFQIQKL